MGERKSLREAIAPDKLAFLKGNRQASAEPAQVSVTQPVIDVPPAVNEEPMVTFTVRLPGSTITALRTASGARKPKRLHPYTQQDIVRYALELWLRERNFLQ
jgi:hypothetical protein